VGFALLFPMNTLFEEYVGRTLRMTLRREGVLTRLQGPRRFVLRDEGGARRFATKPDIVVFEDGKPALVVDTKWKRLSSALDDPKRGVAQADVYQMLAYARVYGVNRLILLYPHHQGLRCEEGRIARFAVGGEDDLVLDVATIDLGSRHGIESRLHRLVSEARESGVRLIPGKGNPIEPLTRSD
jgi:5-methylcytosine-specific restriction enzyme subunit McrC